ncbi:LytR/AlgR family response regulator transcription factor [Paenibacillus sp. GYB003]|uniref:LytR/AlgR family response regulator transcription factor n=1 Tax=Paenibacillus sp. GYB003 TaxID=2994392 RepID=UPI002F961AF3
MARALNVIIAEDQEPDREKLVLYSKKLGLNVLSSVGSGRWFKEDCIKYKPDLVLLDIGLAEQDGVSAFKELVDMGISPYLIMVSGSNDPAHLLAGYELSCLSYVTKPVTFDRLSSAVEKARQMFDRDLAASNPIETKIIEIKSNHKPIFINENRLIYAERSKIERKVHVFVWNHEPIISNSTLSELYAQCSDNIFFPNKSQIVNLNYIDSVYASLDFFGTYKIKLNFQSVEIDLSRRKRKEFESVYEKIKLSKP